MEVEWENNVKGDGVLLGFAVSPSSTLSAFKHVRQRLCTECGVHVFMYRCTSK